MTKIKTDIEIANEANMLPIVEVAKKIGIKEEDLSLYGKYKAKIDDSIKESLGNKKDGKLVLVTAINPTKAGEGKTTTTIGLSCALNKIGKNAIAALREPSLGPCFGIKGGAAGGGYAQAVPMEDLNLHFTGDFHAITTANNLLAALIDNHIMHGNELNIDTKKIIWKRCLDMNDRVLREIVVGMGGKGNGVMRQDIFQITAASEIMAIICLSKSLSDLKNKIDKIIVAYDTENKPVYAKDLKATGAMVALLKEAIKPNLIQTLENTPVLIHGGPFANIAHGCSSIIATNLGLKLADICVTEAGFGADLGAEKFFDIKCRMMEKQPDAVVIVATIRALKYNAYVPLEELSTPSVEALEKGMVNLDKHIENVKKYGLPVVVALNTFSSDTKEEVECIKHHCEKLGATFAISDVWANGGDGGIELANAVVNAIEEKSDFKYLYDVDASIYEKIETIAKEIYGASGIELEGDTKKIIDELTKNGFDKLPICIAKNQYSLSDDPKALGRPENFKLHIRDLYVSNGAGFIVVLTGKMLTMPGLPKRPAAENIDVCEETGNIIGLF